MQSMVQLNMVQVNQYRLGCVNCRGAADDAKKVKMER